MKPVRNIREFVVAISSFLTEKNWLFSSSFSNYTKIMTLLFNIKVEGKNMYLHIVPSDKKPFKCILYLGDKEVYSFESDVNQNFENELNILLEHLKKCVGMDD